MQQPCFKCNRQEEGPRATIDRPAEAGIVIPARPRSRVGGRCSTGYSQPETRREVASYECVGDY
jgi:hypothetical protein